MAIKNTPAIILGAKLNPNWDTMIAKVQTYFTSKGHNFRKDGTGFLLGRNKDFSFLVTAGHNLFDHDANAMASKIEVDLGLNGNVQAFPKQTIEWNGQNAFVAEDFRRGSLENNPEADIGLVRLARLPEEFTYYRLHPFGTVPNHGRVVGYRANDRRTSHRECELSLVEADNFNYDRALNEKGMSGGPILCTPLVNGNFSVAGLHIRGNSTYSGLYFSTRTRNLLDAWAAAMSGAAA